MFIETNCTTEYFYTLDGKRIILTFDVVKLHEELEEAENELQQGIKNIYITKAAGGALINEYMTKKQSIVLKYHKNKITPPAKSNSRWQTYVGHGREHRKLVQGNTYDELLEKLYNIYDELGKTKNITFEECYAEWIIYKEKITSPANADRIDNDYKKFFKSAKFNKMKLNDIDAVALTEECNEIVRKFEMTAHRWRNSKSIINGVYEYAIAKKYIKVDISKMVKVSVGFAMEVKPSSKTQVYDTDEILNLFKYLDKMYAEDSTNTALLCVKINFFLGLRVGELVALKWEDIEGDNLCIKRAEINDKRNKVYRVVNHTKTHRARIITIPEEAQEILKELTHTGKYIFERNGKRLTSRQINYVLEKYAERSGTAVKSSHKIRKTVASLLNAFGAPLELIREILGHKDTRTTHDYLYDPTPEEVKKKLVNSVLSTKSFLANTGTEE